MPDGDWSREEGPRGGTRWVRGNEVRYTEPAGWGGANGEADEAGGRNDDMDEVEASDVSVGDTLVIDGEEAEVSKVSDMGGGYYIAGRTDGDEVVTARVGPDHAFNGQGGETGEDDPPEDDPPEDDPPEDDRPHFDKAPTTDELRDAIQTGKFGADHQRNADLVKDAVKAGMSPADAADVLRDEAHWRAAKRVLPSVSQDIGGVTDDGERLPVNNPHWGAVSELREQMNDRLTDDEEDALQDIRNGWAQGMYNDERIKPMVRHVIENTSNDNLPEWSEQDFEGEVPPEAESAIEKVREFTAEKFREAYGEEVPVYRGVTPEPHTGTPDEGTDIAERLAEASESGEGAEMEHRPVESWTLNPRTAGTYAATGDDHGEEGVILSTTISPEEILFSSQTGAMEPRENEVVVEHDEEAEYDPGEIMTDVSGGSGGVETWLHMLANSEADWE